MLDEGALRQMYHMLEEFALQDGEGALKINYDGFCQVGDGMWVCVVFRKVRTSKDKMQQVLPVRW